MVCLFKLSKSHISGQDLWCILTACIRSGASLCLWLAEQGLKRCASYCLAEEVSGFNMSQVIAL